MVDYKGKHLDVYLLVNPVAEFWLWFQDNSTVEIDGSYSLDLSTYDEIEIIHIFELIQQKYDIPAKITKKINISKSKKSFKESKVWKSWLNLYFSAQKYYLVTQGRRVKKTEIPPPPLMNDLFIFDVTIVISKEFFHLVQEKFKYVEVYRKNRTWQNQQKDV